MGIDKAKAVAVMTANEIAVITRAPNRSDSHPPNGRKTLAGKMNSAVMKPAVTSRKP